MNFWTLVELNPNFGLTALPRLNINRTAYKCVFANGSHMDQNTQLKREYFELRILLNRSNLKTNQKTEISFFIENEKNKSILCASTNKNFKLKLISQNAKSIWQPCGYTRLNNLEVKLSEWANYKKFDNLNYSDLTSTIKSLIFQQLF